MSDGFFPFDVLMDAVGGSRGRHGILLARLKRLKPQLQTDGMVSSIDSGSFRHVFMRWKLRCRTNLSQEAHELVK
jgi:hypothetical protein